VGAVWGADPAFPAREDTFYQWHVEARTDVDVPAGRFKDCFALAYRTNPDHLMRWVCPGVGLVAWEYDHHGTVEQYRAELKEWSAGQER
jgi:hypothetical protein